MLYFSLISKNIQIEIYETIILLLSCGCETWSLSLRKDTFKDSVLRRIFGLKRDEATLEWSRLHNEELHYLYSTSRGLQVIKSRRDGGGGMYWGQERVI